jgi:large subunit ribosomal protein L10
VKKVEQMKPGKLERSKKIEELKEQFKTREGGVLTDFRGLNVAEVTALRTKFREANVSYQVVKNTLTRLAVEGTAYQGIDAFLSGPTAIAFADDAFTAARVATEFAKENEKFKIKGGFMDNFVLSGAQVNEVSQLGGKSDLLARVLSVFNAPSQKFLGVINAVPQKFLGVLQARAEKLEEA